jgi:hypothetical protein
MVLVGRAPGPQRGAAEATLQSGPGGAAHEDEDPRIAALVREHWGHLDAILDGTKVITFPGASVATDEAASAARCALSIRALLPGAPIAVATEWGERDASRPEGDAFDRLAALLARSALALRSGDPAEGAPPRTTIAIDSVTAALIGARFDVGEGPELRGGRDTGSGARMLLGRPSVFVGRSFEVTTIAELFRGVVAEPTARVAVVTGPPGMGKSRLAHEITRAIEGEHPNVEIWRAQGDPRRAASAFGMLGQALLGACGIQQGEPIEARRARLGRRVAAVEDPRRAAAFLGEIVDVHLSDDALPALAAARADPTTMATQLGRAWQELLAAVCAERPLVLLLEDLQWGDLPTVRVVDQALGALDHLPWMVLAFARPEVHQAFPRLWASHVPHEVRLRPLSQKAAQHLVRSALEGKERVDDETVARLVALGDGNAFFLEELVRALAERGAAASSATSNGESFPDTVLAMVQARFDAIGPDDRRIVRAASVFGDVFWPRAVAALVGADGLAERLAQLVDAREIFARRPSSRFAGEEELAFRHTLLREAAYAALTPGDRALGHLLAGAWLEAHGEADAELLAHHFEIGGDASRAAGHALRAARRAMYGLDFDAAVARAEQALQGATSDDVRIAAADLLGEVAAWRYEWPAAARHAELVLSLASPQSKAWLHSQSAKLGSAFVNGQRAALSEASAALLAAEPAGDAVRIGMDALTFCTYVLCLVGRFDEAATAVRKVDALAAERGEADPLARAHRQMAHLHIAMWASGDPWAALGHAEAARDAYAEAQDTRDALYAACQTGLARLYLGQAEEAERVLRAIPGRDFSLVTKRRDEHLLPVLLARGSLDEVRALLAARDDQARRLQGRAREVVEARNRWLLGAVARRADEPAAAAREIATALDRGLRTMLHDLPPALAELAAARLALGQPEEALAAAREAMGALAAAGGSTYYGPRVRLVHAEALLAAGDRDAARAAIADARARILAIAGRIDDPEARPSFLERVPENARTLALDAGS